jgi:AcrR family transcriptional regulator
MGRPRKFSREGVLRKALPVFWKYGFARTTLPDLEQATGVNKSGLYAEFESKEALFLACLRHYHDTHSGGVLLMAEPLGWGNIQRFLEEAPSCAIDQRGCFSVNSMRELDGLPAEARKVIANGRAKLNRLLRANVAFEKPKMEVNSLCELISAFFSGICIEANLNPDRKRAQRKIWDFMQMLRAA